MAAQAHPYHDQPAIRSTKNRLDTGEIKDWRSIVTLIVFVITNILVLFPQNVPIPRLLTTTTWNILSKIRVTPARAPPPRPGSDGVENTGAPKERPPTFPINFVTAPPLAALFLIAILAIGRQEVHDGTIGTDNISPLDIMVFFLSLAYIAISIDASGLIRWLAFRVVQWGHSIGSRLYFYLYLFFFAMTSMIGNDPIILSGTAFLAYMTLVSRNITDPKAWIHTQFAVANIGSAILVSSNPTNLVLAGAFKIKFVHYTVNMVVPVIVTAAVLFPFLLFIVFADKSLIPNTIELHESRDGDKKKPVNPNIRNARENLQSSARDLGLDEQSRDQLLELLREEIMNPWLDKKAAAFGALIMATTLISLLALNAANQIHQVYWVTLPAAVITFCWDVVRDRTRDDRQESTLNTAEADLGEKEKQMPSEHEQQASTAVEDEVEPQEIAPESITQVQSGGNVSNVPSGGQSRRPKARGPSITLSEPGNVLSPMSTVLHESPDTSSSGSEKAQEPATLVSIIENAYLWLRDTFPVTTSVLGHLPFALVPFALAMFVLVQGLVTKGWVPVFAYGWDRWVEKTGTIGSIGGMGFLSVVLCNFAGTNIGTTILLSRVIQAWQRIHDADGVPISNRTFWATVYSMALGVNYGAFSAAFSASLAGLLWRDILHKKEIEVKSLDFARTNLPIIAIAMTVGCVVLIGEVYIFMDNQPYKP